MNINPCNHMVLGTNNQTLFPSLSKTDRKILIIISLLFLPLGIILAAIYLGNTLANHCIKQKKSSADHKGNPLPLPQSVSTTPNASRNIETTPAILEEPKIYEEAIPQIPTVWEALAALCQEHQQPISREEAEKLLETLRFFPEYQQTQGEYKMIQEISSLENLHRLQASNALPHNGVMVHMTGHQTVFPTIAALNGTNPKGTLSATLVIPSRAMFSPESSIGLILAVDPDTITKTMIRDSHTPTQRNRELAEDYARYATRLKVPFAYIQRAYNMSRKGSDKPSHRGLIATHQDRYSVLRKLVILTAQKRTNEEDKEAIQRIHEESRELLDRFNVEFQTEYSSIAELSYPEYQLICLLLHYEQVEMTQEEDKEEYEKLFGDSTDHSSGKLVLNALRALLRHLLAVRSQRGGKVEGDNWITREEFSPILDPTTVTSWTYPKDAEGRTGGETLYNELYLHLDSPLLLGRSPLRVTGLLVDKEVVYNPDNRQSSEIAQAAFKASTEFNLPLFFRK